MWVWVNFKGICTCMKKADSLTHVWCGWSHLCNVFMYVRVVTLLYVVIRFDHYAGSNRKLMMQRKSTLPSRKRYLYIYCTYSCTYMYLCCIYNKWVHVCAYTHTKKWYVYIYIHMPLAHPVHYSKAYFRRHFNCLTCYFTVYLLPIVHQYVSYLKHMKSWTKGYLSMTRI